MSVESEILRIQRNIADTYTVVSEKGGDVPLQPTVANLARSVETIPKLSAGEGIDIDNGVISVKVPTKYLTWAEYNALTKEEKMADVQYIIMDAYPPTSGGASIEVYSTEETVIGTWINGKPLYKCGFPFSITTSSMATAVTLDGFQASDIDELVAQYGSCLADGDTKFSVGGYYIEYYIAGNGLVMSQRNSISGRYNYSGYVIFEYTKTTD